MTSRVNTVKTPFRVQSEAELWACALLIETNAVDTYEMLADQMQMHNNQEVADFFSKMVDIEKLHVQHIEKMSRNIKLPTIDESTIAWPDNQPPESPHHESMHYLMTPHHAVLQAIEAEKSALVFYQQITSSDAPDKVRNWAKELAAEEEEHVELLQHWLQKYPATGG